MDVSGSSSHWKSERVECPKITTKLGKLGLSADMRVHAQGKTHIIPAESKTPSAGLLPTPLQRTMFHRCIERPNAGLYLIQRIWRAPVRIDLEHARQALACVVAHHEALRAYFCVGEGREPQLFIADNVDIDVVWLGRLENEKDLQSFLAVDRARAVNFDSPPLWRMSIFRSDTSDIVVWTCHHIVVDAPSFAAIFRDWRLALSAIIAGKAPQLTPARPPSFVDHLVALKVADTATARALWTKQLSGFSGGTPLPVLSIGRRGVMLRAFEDTEIEDAELLSARAHSHGTTLNAVVQGAWALALARCNGTEDVTFGTTRAGRYSLGQGRATATGMFITTVPFRVDTKGSQTVGSWLKGLAQQQVALRAGEFSSPAQIHAWANLSGELPLFRTVLVFSQDGSEEAERASGELRVVSTSEGVTLAADAGRHLRLQLEYPSEEYSAVQIQTVLAHVRKLILALTQAPSDQTLATIAINVAGELDRPDSSPIPTTHIAFPREQSVVDLFRLAARHRPAAPAIRCCAQEMSYGELDRRSDQVAALLLRGGLSLEEIVVLVLDRSVEFIVAALGVLKAGGSYLALDPYAPPQRLRQQFMQSDARWALTMADLRGKVAEYTDKIIEVDTSLNDFAHKGNNAANLCAAVASNPDRRAYLISTSGSTGAPKMVEIEHHSLANLIVHYERHMALTTNDRISWLSPPAFDASVADLWPGLCSGATIIIPEKQYATDPDGLIVWIANEAITIAFVPTPLAELLLRRSWPDRLALRFFGTGGDVLHVRPPCNLPFVVVNAYGPTENTVDATWGVVHPGPSSRRPTIGRPITNVTAYVLDQQRRLLPSGEAGELYLGGEQVARGYLNEPQLTRERFIPNPFFPEEGRLYRTGDLVRWDEYGDLEFLGRIDLQIQIGGYQVEPEEVECVLFRHPDVIEACCTPIKDGIVARGLVAHIASSATSTELLGPLRDFLRAQLPAYMIPSDYIFYASLPHTYAGKIDRAALSVHPLRPPPERRPSVQTFDSQLLALWHEILPAAENIETGKTFWDLGGDSLKLIQLSLGVEEITGQILSLPTFLMDPTLRGLRDALERPISASPDESPRITAETALGRDTPSAIVQFRDGNDALPLYFVGFDPAIAQLARTMDTEGPVFIVEKQRLSVLRHAIMNNKNVALPTVETFAAPVVAALTNHAQTSSFVLAGHSTMGIVAFEVAHQMRNLGAKVEAVILLDTWLRRPPRRYVMRAKIWEKLVDYWKQTGGGAQNAQLIPLIHGYLRRAALIFSIITAKGAKIIFQFLMPRSLKVHVRGDPAIRDLKTAGELTTVLDAQGTPLEWGIVDKLYGNAEKTYQAHVLDCRGILFKTCPDEERIERAYDETLGWKDLFGKDLEIVPIPGDHKSMVRDKTCRTILASKMIEVLRKIP